MKTMIAFLLSAGAALADPIEGVWQTQPGKDGGFGHVRIAPCGAGFCGDVIRSFDAEGREVAATPQRVIEGVAPDGDAYRGGTVTNPETGKSYDARLILNGDRLDVGGCILGICRSGGVWIRAAS